MAWILVVRRRAIGQWLGLGTPFLGAARRTMRLHRRTVDHDERGRIGAFDESGEQTLPQPALAPTIVPVEHRRIRPVFIRKRTPSTAFTQPVDDPADDAPIILPLRPGMDHRKMRRERRKLFVRQPKIVRHDLSPPYRLESRQITRFNWVQTLANPGSNLTLGLGSDRPNLPRLFLFERLGPEEFRASSSLGYRSACLVERLSDSGHRQGRIGPNHA